MFHQTSKPSRKHIQHACKSPTKANKEKNLRSMAHVLGYLICSQEFMLSQGIGHEDMDHYDMTHKLSGSLMKDLAGNSHFA